MNRIYIGSGKFNANGGMLTVNMPSHMTGIIVERSIYKNHVDDKAFIIDGKGYSYNELKSAIMASEILPDIAETGTAYIEEGKPLECSCGCKHFYSGKHSFFCANCKKEHTYKSEFEKNGKKMKFYVSFCPNKGTTESED